MLAKKQSLIFLKPGASRREDEDRTKVYLKMDGLFGNSENVWGRREKIEEEGKKKRERKEGEGENRRRMGNGERRPRRSEIRQERPRRGD